MSMDEFLAHVEDSSPPAPVADLRALERELSVELPDDYRQFLLRCNGGYVGGRLWYRGPTPGGEPADAGIHHIGGFRSESYFSLRSARATYDGRIPRELLWIMDDPFGNAICVCVSGPKRGAVYFWDHEREPQPDKWNGSIETAANISLLADSFAEFIAGVRPTEAH